MRKLLLPAVALAAVLAGCSSNATTTTASHPAAAQDKPSTTRDQLVLTIADFPAGTQSQPITQEQLAKATGAVAETQKTATFDPPQCAGSQQDVSKALAELQSKASFTYGINDSSMYLSAVSDETRDLDAVKSQLTGPCSTVTVQMATEGITTKTTTHTTALPVPAGLGADQAIAYETTTSTAMPGGGAARPMEVNGASGLASVRGLTVMVRVQGFGGPVDTATFDRLFTEAVAKVRNAK